MWIGIEFDKLASNSKLSKYALNMDLQIRMFVAVFMRLISVFYLILKVSFSIISSLVRKGSILFSFFKYVLHV